MPPRTLVIGCGNLLRGDDAAGPVLVRRMRERGLPDGVNCADCGTGGIDAALQMRGVRKVVLVDACTSGSEPGTLFEVPGREVENLPPLSGINLHAFRWDHAIACGRWLLDGDFPADVTAYLVEGEQFEVGAGLSPRVDAAVDRLVDLLFVKLASAEPPLEFVQIHMPAGGGDWHPGPRADEVTSGRLLAFEAGGEKIVVVSARGELRAFRNACGHVGLPLDRGTVDVEAGTIICPWHGYRFDAGSGACLSAPDCALKPFPLRVVRGVVEVRI